MQKNQIIIVITIVFMFVTSTPWIASCIGVQHQVQEGETLSEIAEKYEVPMKSIVQTNSIESVDRLRVGERLLIPVEPKSVPLEENSKVIWYDVKPGDTLYGIAKRYNVKWEELQQINGISNPKRLRAGKRIFIQGDNREGFSNPLRIPLVVTSRYGMRLHPVKRRYLRHEGIDFRAATGTRVYAAKTGRILYAARKSGYGKTVVIQHADNFTTWYGHLSRIRVSTGEIVKQGEVIGLSGDTGISTGPHLHFEIRNNGKSENPERHLDIR